MPHAEAQSYRRGMDPIAFTIELTGEAVELDDGHFWAETRGLDTVFGADQALCRRNLELGDDGTLVESGEISFGADDAVTFRADGTLGPSPDPRVKHGAAVLTVTGGRGRLAGASGFVTSNFLLGEGGALTDHQQGLLFVEPNGGASETP